jgi:hypothetical protein
LVEIGVECRAQLSEELANMHLRYIGASPPGEGEKATIAYRLRLPFLDRWNL